MSSHALTDLGKGATGAKPAAGEPCSNRDLGPAVSTDAPKNRGGGGGMSSHWMRLWRWLAVFACARLNARLWDEQHTYVVTQTGPRRVEE